MTCHRNILSSAVISTLFLLIIGGCALIKPVNNGELPPLLSQDELIRPYTKLGRIQVTRETYGSDYSMTPNIREWGFNAVRQEAAKMGADAITLFEVDGRTTVYGVLPSTEYRATGIAIKFK